MLNDRLSHDSLWWFTFSTCGELPCFDIDSTAIDQIEHLCYLGYHAHVFALDELTLLRLLLIGRIIGRIICILIRVHRLLVPIWMIRFPFLLFFLNSFDHFWSTTFIRHLICIV